MKSKTSPLLSLRVKARQWREDLSKGVSNPKDVARFYDDVVSGRVPPKRALREALANGVFGTAEDMRAASTFVQSFEDGEDRISKAMGGQVSKQILDAIRQRTMADTMLEMNPLLGISDEGFEAQSDFRQLLTRWIISNPNATQYEIDEQATKFGKQITDRFERVEGEDPKYMAQGVTRFITYTGSPDMLHVDLKKQKASGGKPWFMHDKSARNLRRAPAWLRSIAEESTSI